MKYVVNYSGGMSSHLAAKRIVEEVGAENTLLLFCDTRTEDADLYRYLEEGAKQLGAPLVKLCDGRTIWQVFWDEKYLGNTRADPCSKILKRKLADKFVRAHFKPGECVQVFGYAMCEVNRLERTAARLHPYDVRAPLTEAPTVRANQVLAEHVIECPDLRPPRLYALGAPHNNCGGLCVKAGQKHFAWALKNLPEVYATWEANEEALRLVLGDVAILRDRTGGDTKPLPLSLLRERTARGCLPAPGDDAACSCFDPDESEEIEALI